MHLTPAQLRHAAGLKEKIEALQHQLSQLKGIPGTTAEAAEPAPRARKKISAAGIARIRAAQKLRWAKVKNAAPAGPAKPGKRGRKKMSLAGRAKMAAAAKARWARVRAEKAGN